MDFNKMYSEIQEIKQQLSDKVVKVYESKELHELAAALSTAQGEMVAASATSTNPFFKSKYASFSDVVHASRPSLSKNKLSVIQRMILDDKHGLIIETKLMHASGQWISSIMPINPPKDDAQARGSYISYMKRYSYAALVGVCTEDEDDDGNSAASQERKQQARVALNKNYERVTSEQVQNIMFEIGEHTDIAESLIKNFNITKLSEIPKEYYLKVVQKIRDNVASRKK